MRAPPLTLLAALGALSCAPPIKHAVMRSGDPQMREQSPELLPLPSLKHDPNPFEMGHDPERRRDHPASSPLPTYRFELERSGTQEALRAVVSEPGRPALVVGDRGTALFRLPESGWKSETTGTTEHLFALSRIHAPGQSSSEDTGPVSYLAVGAHGVALVRSPEGRWRRETTGTTADLHALWGTLAVGSGGAMVKRSPDGSWRTIPTRTRADLHGIGLCDGRVCAVGEGGTVVECVFSAKGEPVCIPRKPPTTATLRAVTGEVFLLGDGVWLSIAPPSAKDPSSPPEWQPWRFAGQMGGNAQVHAVAKNTWVNGETLMVGPRGDVWLVGNWIVNEHPIQKIDLPYHVDFHGVAYERADGFMVGDGGTIVKLGVRDYRLPQTIPD